MTTNNPDVSVGPISVSERIETIDILRGFALFGILVVNMAAFMHPVFLALLPVNPQMPVWDKVVHGLIVFLAQGKFISLFSLLFGLGVAIQFDRGRLHGRPVIPVYLRRLLILFLIGCVHAFLIWPGDVLILYAVAGLGLILFRNCQLKTIWRWAVSILTVILMLMCVGFLMTEVLIRVDPQAAAELMTNGQESQWRAEAAQSYLAYSSGTYAEVTAQRIHEYSSMAGSLFAFIPQLFAMFLIGFLLGRSRLFEQVEAYRATLTKALIWCGLVGLIASGIATILTMNGYMTMGASPWFYVNAIAGLVSYPMLCMFYLCAVTLLCEQTKWRHRMRFFAPVGRLSLSNYLLQSLVCTLIFNGYGLGFYGKGGAAAGLLLSIILYALQVVFSIWWINRFNYGPMEWLWRSMTYLRLQPMRKAHVVESSVETDVIGSAG